MTAYREIAEKIRQADAVLIGVSNGLSITEGLHLFADNQAFDEVFGDLKRKYGLRCILQGMGAKWPSEEEKWGFWSRLIRHYCGEYRETPVMADLKKVIGKKEYFVVTSNGECHFEMCGFAPEKIYEVEGNWLTMQCAARCHEKVYPGPVWPEGWRKQSGTGKSFRSWFLIVRSAAGPCRSIWRWTEILSPRLTAGSVWRLFWSGIAARSWRFWSWVSAGEISSSKRRLRGWRPGSLGRFM